MIKHILLCSRQFGCDVPIIQSRTFLAACFFHIDALNITSPYLVDGEPIFYGLKNKDGALAVVACYNNDLENFWDYIDEGIYPLKPSVEAFRLGINFLIYSMSH